MGDLTFAPSVRVVSLAIGGAIEQAAFAVGVVLAVRFQFLKLRMLSGSGDSAAPEQQTNCPSWGARTSTEADVCAYCGERLDEDSSQ